MLRFLTAGESHGESLLGILEGMPAGLSIDREAIDHQLSRRQRGHGRGQRQVIEQDRVLIQSGVRHGMTLGSPIGLRILNRDWVNWKDVMSPDGPGDPERKRVTVPRPGHADYQGAVKYGHADMRNVLERASARETAMRVAIGSLTRQLLAELDIELASRVVSIGAVTDTNAVGLSAAELTQLTDASEVRCADVTATRAMIEAIDQARDKGDTLGGVFELRAYGLPVGLGSYSHWDRRLEGQLAQSLMSLNAIKGVEIGDGFELARKPGSQAHDALYWSDDKNQPVRHSNHSGGIDGGVTTGETLLIRCAMKPISTLMKPLESVDLATQQPKPAHVERSDICAVPSAAVIGESLIALVLAEAVMQKFGGDTMSELTSRYEQATKK